MEQDEWKKIYQLYFKPLYLYALSLTHSTQDAEDLLQETFVKAFLSYKSTGSIKTWLIIVLKHEFLNVRRKQKREILNGDTAYDEQNIMSNPDTIISDILIKEEKRRLFNSIQKLPGMQKEILIESIYFEVMYPYNEVASIQIEKEGFSRYMLNMQIIDHKGPISIGRPNVKIEMFRGKFKVKEDINNMVTKLLNRFDMEDILRVKKELEKLPESAVIYLSVGETNPRPLSELRKENITLEWLQVNQPNSEFQGGISMGLNCPFKDTDKRGGMTEEELKKVYISNLQELLSSEYIWKDLGLASGSRVYNYPKEVLQNCLDDAEKISVLTTKNYCISGSKNQILNYLKNTNIKSIYVDKIRLSSLN